MHQTYKQIPYMERFPLFIFPQVISVSFQTLQRLQNWSYLPAFNRVFP